MSRKLYVGNLPYDMTSHGLEAIFSTIGEVIKTRVIMDRETQRSRGFGFVEMANESLAGEAISTLHGTEHGGRKLSISIAREPSSRPPSHDRGHMIGYR